MKKLLYIVTLSLFAFNVSAEAANDGMNAKSSEMSSEQGQVNAVTASDIMPATSADAGASETTAATEQSGLSQGSVTRSIFTTQISEHEPTDKVEKLNSNNRSIYYFTELRDMSGQTAMHRWEFNGNVMAETKFTVAGPRWRVWSSKNLLPTWTGEWKVSVLNGVGDVISEDIFSYIAEEMVETSAQPETMPGSAAGSMTDSQEANTAPAQ